MIAFDATDRPRYQGETLGDFFQKARAAAPGKLLMADIATLEEAVRAERLGFDCVSTTLMGYTAQSAGHNIADDDFSRLKAILAAVHIPVIAEGQCRYPCQGAPLHRTGRARGCHRRRDHPSPADHQSLYRRDLRNVKRAQKKSAGALFRSSKIPVEQGIQRAVAGFPCISGPPAADR